MHALGDEHDTPASADPLGGVLLNRSRDHLSPFRWTITGGPTPALAFPTAMQLRADGQETP